MYISESDKVAIRQLIEKQLQAFQQQDEATAFSLTSPTIQKKFARQDFIKAIAEQYSSMTQPRSIMFRGFTLINDFPALVSTVMDREGSLSQGIFIVQHQRDYSWRIHGYELVSMDEKIISY